MVVVGRFRATVRWGRIGWFGVALRVMVRQFLMCSLDFFYLCIYLYSIWVRCECYIILFYFIIISMPSLFFSSLFIFLKVKLVKLSLILVHNRDLLNR